MRMVYHIPSEFTDEDKWFRIFYKKNLLVMICGLGFTGVIAKAGALFGMQLPMIIFGLIVTAVITGITMLPVPETQYLKGGGQTLDIILIRMFIRKKNSVLYVRGYNKDGQED